MDAWYINKIQINKLEFEAGILKVLFKCLREEEKKFTCKFYSFTFFTV